METKVIEAKATDIKLSEDEGRQAVSYAYHTGIKFAVLTNFKQIRVYHALSHIKNIDKNLLKDDKGYMVFDCENFIEQFDRLWLLSRKSLENEEISEPPHPKGLPAGKSVFGGVGHLTAL